jgi:hypothetical protein
MRQLILGASLCGAAVLTFDGIYKLVLVPDSGGKEAHKAEYPGDKSERQLLW